MDEAPAIPEDLAKGHIPIRPSFLIVLLVIRRIVSETASSLSIISWAHQVRPSETDARDKKGE